MSWKFVRQVRRTDWRTRMTCRDWQSHCRKGLFFEILTLHRKVFFLRNWQFARSDRGRVWSSRDLQAWKFVRQVRRKLTYRMTCRDWQSRVEKVFFLRFWQCVEIHFFLRNWQFARSDRGRVWSSRDLQAWKFVRQVRRKLTYRMTCRDWQSQVEKVFFLRFWLCTESHFFWEIDNSHAQTGVEFGRRVTCKHENLSGRSGGSWRTEWHVVIDSPG